RGARWSERRRGRRVRAARRCAGRDRVLRRRSRRAPRCARRSDVRARGRRLRLRGVGTRLVRHRDAARRIGARRPAQAAHAIRNGVTVHASFRSRWLLPALAAALLVPGRARADGDGFALDRYQPTPAGEWFFSVEHPWYSSTRWFAGGFTLDYGRKPLVAGLHAADGSFTETTSVVSDQLVGHFDLAASFLDRILVSASLPVTLYEAGSATPV